MPQQILAAVDLGSNSFHLQIARVVNQQLYPLDSMKETVRLGAGISAERKIEAKTAELVDADVRAATDHQGRFALFDDRRTVENVTHRR